MVEARKKGIRNTACRGTMATRRNFLVDNNLKKAGEPQPIIEDLKKRRVPAIKREPKKAGMYPPKRENLKKYDRDVVKLTEFGREE